ncbi:response regulator [Streptomyces niveus]|uniref:response regulator n=1 Tax=Streptomyces niveus TaxID=193462 RepID=UPI003425D98C
MVEEREPAEHASARVWGHGEAPTAGPATVSLERQTLLIRVVLRLSSAAVAAIVALLGLASAANPVWVLLSVAGVLVWAGAQADERARAAARADERDHQRRLHDTVLATLTMVIADRSEALRHRAPADLQAIDAPAPPDGTPAGLVPLAPPDVALRAAASMPRPGLPAPTVELGLGAVLLPRPVVNVVRHAGTTAAQVRAEPVGAACRRRVRPGKRLRPRGRARTPQRAAGVDRCGRFDRHIGDVLREGEPVVAGVSMARPGTAFDVGIIDDHPVVIDGVRAWLAEEPNVRVRHTGERVEDLRSSAADVLIVDLNLNGRLVLPDIGALAAEGQRIVVFSQFTDESLVMDVLDMGASGFVTKSEGQAHLLHAVRAAAADRPYVPPTTAGVLVSDRSPVGPRLSDQERTSLLWWFQSMSKASVARRMGVSVHTVDMYIKRARVKYAQVGRAAPTKADMLARAIQDGLVTPGEVANSTPRTPPPM